MMLRLYSASLPSWACSVTSPAKQVDEHREPIRRMEEETCSGPKR